MHDDFDRTDPVAVREHMLANHPSFAELTDVEQQRTVDKLVLLGRELTESVEAWNELPHDIWDD